MRVFLELKLVRLLVKVAVSGSSVLSRFVVNCQQTELVWQIWVSFRRFLQFCILFRHFLRDCQDFHKWGLGSIPGFFLGKSEDLCVMTAKALWLKGFCCLSNSYLITLQLSSVATFTSLCLWPGGICELQVIDFVSFSILAHSVLDSPGMTLRRISGVLFVYGYSGWLCCCQKNENGCVRSGQLAFGGHL